MTAIAPAISPADLIRQSVRRLAAFAGADLLLLLFLTSLLMTVAASVHGEVRWLHPSLGLPVGVFAGVLFVDFVKWAYFLAVHRQNKALQFLRQIPIALRDWLPFVLIDLMYENLHDLSPHLVHYDITPFLFRLDTWLCGVSPTVLAQRFYSPGMTDAMTAFYAIYLALPLILMSILTLAGRREAFQKVSIAVAFTFVIGFAGYVLTPALPPRFYIPHLFAGPLPSGILLGRAQAMWDKLAVVKGAAFPSLHVGVSTTALIYAFRYRSSSTLYRILWWVYIPLTLGLWLSTIYLRHHWLGDIAGGWIVAALATWISDRLFPLGGKWAERGIA
jgi:membrane-associated phospholipid phosphatase